MVAPCAVNPVEVAYPNRIVEVGIEVKVHVEVPQRMDIRGPEVAKVKAGPVAVPPCAIMVEVATIAVEVTYPTSLNHCEIEVVARPIVPVEEIVSLRPMLKVLD